MNSHSQKDAWSGYPREFKAADFIARNQVFRVEAFREAHRAAGGNANASAVSLSYHLRAGRLRTLRRGLYGAPGWLDPWLVGSRLTPDAVIAYDGAFSFHGLGPLGHGISYVTAEHPFYFCFQQVVYRATKGEVLYRDAGIEKHERQGLPLCVTSRERTLVDLLDRVDLISSLSSLFAAFKKLRGALDIDLMVDYTLSLKRRLTAGRVGLVLCQLSNASRRHLARLEATTPHQPTYFDRRFRGTKHVAEDRWRILLTFEMRDALGLIQNVD